MQRYCIFKTTKAKNSKKHSAVLCYSGVRHLDLNVCRSCLKEILSYKLSTNRTLYNVWIDKSQVMDYIDFWFIILPSCVG